MTSSGLPDGTVEGLGDSPRGAPGRWFRRIGVTALTLLVLAGLVGLLGPRTAETSASAGGYELTVVHPAVTRAGEPAPLHVVLESRDGFGGPVRLALCDDWFDDYDFQAWYPTPAKETGGAGVLVYEFDPPDGSVLEVSLDARSAPGELWSTDSCSVTVFEDEVSVVDVGFTTWRMP